MVFFIMSIWMVSDLVSVDPVPWSSTSSSFSFSHHRPKKRELLFSCLCSLTEEPEAKKVAGSGGGGGSRSRGEDSNSSRGGGGGGGGGLSSLGGGGGGGGGMQALPALAGPVTSEDIKVPDKMVGLSEYLRLVLFALLTSQRCSALGVSTSPGLVPLFDNN